MKIDESPIIEAMRSKKSRHEGLKMMMDTYQSRLYWHIKRLVVRHDETQDLLQNSFIKAYQNFDKFRGGSQLYTWLYRIATNEALQYLDKLKKMHTTGSNVEGLLQHMTDKSANQNPDGIEAILSEAIQTLPEKQKLVFSLKYYDDLPYEKISEILDISVGSLKTSYHYAKEKVTKYLIENSDSMQ